MSEQELMTLAAKAVGIEIYFRDDGSCFQKEMQGNPSFRYLVPWDPLTDDGQAFGLAADLRLKILPGKHKGDGCTVESQRQGIAGCTTFRDDKREQMRRAIVRVAAEIGKAMP
jgi:hypothetical protein